MCSAAVLAGLAGASALPATASAATAVVRGGNDIDYDGDAGANEVVIRQSGRSVTFTEPTNTITPLTGCVAVTAREVTCTASSDSFRINVVLGSGNDTGVADESVTAPIRWTPFVPVDGSDPGPGNDDYEGGEGPDTFFAEGGADRYRGDAGVDAASYDRDSHAAGVAVSLNGIADDGRPGEGDNVQTNIEQVIGSAGSDVLTGSNSDDDLIGGAGSDNISGNGGTDLIWGDDPDTCAVSGSSDLLSGDAGVDNLSGCGGNDTLRAGPGSDRFDGGPGSRDVLSFFAYSANVTADLDRGELGADPDVDVTAVEDLTGGAGADVLTGDGGANVIRGGPGGDVLRGGTGPDELHGEDGGDALRGDAGSDALHGGPQNDTVAEYAELSTPVSVTLDGIANDGPAGAADNVHPDVETVLGGSAGDNLVGSGGPETLDGRGGPDVIDGRGGNDAIFGSDGNDDLTGGTGADSLRGDADDDTLRARDAIVDSSLECGPGADLAIVDADDPATVGCETEDRPGPRASLSATSHDFGQIEVGTQSAPVTFTITNAGTLPLTVGAVGLSGPAAEQFSVSAGTCAAATLAPGETCSLQARFAPSGPGSHAAAITIDSNDPAGSATIALTGTATEAGAVDGGFRLGKVKRNKRKGTAKLTVIVSGPGELRLARTGKVKQQRKRVSAAGRVRLSVKPKSAAKRKLAAKGKARVKAKVTFTPAGGTPTTRTKRIKLVRR